ncbi:MAG TPA: response regulator transcription factor [Acidimicrobiales bacterium]|nr:response regulator transcription factor [Acidimicrobiales bacterium]
MGAEAEPENTSILLVEDHVVLAEAMALALRLRGFGQLVALPADELDHQSVLAAADRHQPSVVLLDLHLGHDRSGMPLIEPLTSRGASVMILTGSQDHAQLARCLELGANGVFDKSRPLDELVDALHAAATGQTVLTPEERNEYLSELRRQRNENEARLAPFRALTAREEEVLTAVCDGLSAEAIAEEQFVSVATVRSHIKSVLNKLGVNSQLAAVALVRRSGWGRTRRATDRG